MNNNKTMNNSKQLTMKLMSQSMTIEAKKTASRSRPIKYRQLNQKDSTNKIKINLKANTNMWRQRCRSQKRSQQRHPKQTPQHKNRFQNNSRRQCRIKNKRQSTKKWNRQSMWKQRKRKKRRKRKSNLPSLLSSVARPCLILHPIRLYFEQSNHLFMLTRLYRYSLHTLHESHVKGSTSRKHIHKTVSQVLT